MRTAIPLLVSLAWIGVAAACQPASEGSQGLSRADSVSVALLTFDETVFDTLAWPSGEEMLERGRVVFEISCTKCHGPTGAGDGNFVFRGDTLSPPSWLGADWRLANRPIRLRRYIFSGSVAGMPYWGLVGLNYRDIDAVASYILQVLRPTYGEGQG